MVYHYRTVRCPKCDKVADKTRTIDNQILKGSPFRVCPHCGEAYFDPKYHEAAIEVFKDKGGELNIWGVLWALIANGLLVFLIIHSIKEKEMIWLPFSLVLGFALLIDIGLVRLIKHKVQADTYHKNSIDILEGKTGELTGELAASMERMNNKEYLNALKAYGIVVPDYFYQRLNKCEASSFHMPQNIVTVDEKKIEQLSKEVNEKQTATDGGTDTKQETSISIEAAFCRKCGSKIPADSVFCPRCGEKVISFHI